MRIWCIKLVNVLVLHINPWVEAYAGGLLFPVGLYRPVAKYFGTSFKRQMWIELSRNKVNFVNSSQNKGLSPSGIALSFNGFGSISLHSVWFSSEGSFSFHFFSDFQLFRPMHHWKYLSSRNAHLVHQNC
jgi:hypothetical protein